MGPLRHAGSPSRHLARIAVAGMSVAVIALGGLAVWAAIVTQNGAHGLTQAGVQSSGHLRAMQAVSMIDTQVDLLEESHDPRELRRLRRAQHVLAGALGRMERGGVREATRIAVEAKPIVARLRPAIDRFLVTRGGDTDEEPEEAL